MADAKDFIITISDANGKNSVRANQKDTDVVFHSDEKSIVIDCGDAVRQIPRSWDISCPECTVLKVKKGGFEYLGYREKRQIGSVAIPLLIKRFPKCYKVKGPVIGGEAVSKDAVKVDFWTATRIDEPARMMGCALHTPRQPQSLERVYSKFESDLAEGQKHNPTYNAFIARNFRNLMWGGLGHKDYTDALIKRVSDSDAVADLWLDANCYNLALKACEGNVEAKSRVVAWGTRHYDLLQELEMKRLEADASEWDEVIKRWRVFPDSYGASLYLDQVSETVVIPPSVGKSRISSVSIRKNGVKTLVLGGYIRTLDMQELADFGIEELSLGDEADIGFLRKDKRITVTGSDAILDRFASFNTIR